MITDKDMDLFRELYQKANNEELKEMLDELTHELYLSNKCIEEGFYD